MFGIHVNRIYSSERNIASHIQVVIDRLKEQKVKMSCCIIFLSSPRNQKIIVSDEEITDLREMQDITIFAHSSYLDRPWPTDKYQERSIKFINEEIEVCERANLSGLIIHLPKNAKVESLVPVVKQFKFSPRSHVKIYFELCGLGDQTFISPELIAKFFALIGTDHFSFCIDTAHLWSSGLDISDVKVVTEWFSALESYDEILPMNSLMIHLNDSAKPIGKTPDEHAPLGIGEIWGKSDDSLEIILNYASKWKIPVIIERNKNWSDIANDADLVYAYTTFARL